MIALFCCTKLSLFLHEPGIRQQAEARPAKQSVRLLTTSQRCHRDGRDRGREYDRDRGRDRGRDGDRHRDRDRERGRRSDRDEEAPIDPEKEAQLLAALEQDSSDEEVRKLRVVGPNSEWSAQGKDWG